MWGTERLLRTLRQKWRPVGTPIYLVNGSYPVRHEGGYDWTVGAFRSRAYAEGVVTALMLDLKNARKKFASLLAAERSLYRAHEREWHKLLEDGHEDWYEVSQKSPLHAAHTEAYFALRDAIDTYPFKDEQLPHPASHLFDRGDDGPYRYSIQEIQLV